MSTTYKSSDDANRSNDDPSFDRQEALKTNDAIVDVMFGWHREVVNFYGHRFKQYADLPARFAECQNVRGLHDIQSQFFDRMFSDYREKASQLFDLTRELTSQTLRQEDNHYEKAILKAQEDARQLLRQAKENAEIIIRDAENAAEKIVREAPRTKGKVA